MARVGRANSPTPPGGGVAKPVPGATMFAILVAGRLRVLGNSMRAVLRGSRLRLGVGLLLLLVIWAALFGLFAEAIAYMQRTDLIGPVVLRYMFDFFFVALLVMLIFSSAILSYGGLFASGEPPYLLACPVPHRLVGLIKYLEALFFASWSLVLLGLPLIAALGVIRHESWFFYPFFLLFFLAFIMVPGSIGMALAVLVGRFFAREARRMLIGVGLIGTLGGVWYVVSEYQQIANSPDWLDRFVQQIAFVRSSLLPSTWVAAGVTAISQGQLGQGCFYLLVLLANGLMGSWVAVSLTGRWLMPAYNRVQAGRNRSVLFSGRITAALVAVCHCWLRAPMRQIILKDLRMFVRDPVQWSQLAIFLGLLALYVVNIPRLGVDVGTAQSKHTLGFLNMAAMCLILATFTARFVFPLISLEGRQQWMLGVVPLTVRQIIWCKQIHAASLTGLSAVVVTALAGQAIRMTPAWQGAYLVIALATAWGLCGISIGLGARFAVFDEPSGARIASGFGGAVNLVGAMSFVVVSLLIVGWLNFRAARDNVAFLADRPFYLGVAGLVALSVLTAQVAMRLGGRHLRRIDY